MGAHIRGLVPSGTSRCSSRPPGSANIQPRIEGAEKTLKKYPAITPHVIATGAAVPGELTAIEAYFAGHPETKGMFAVDAGSTQGVAQTIQKHGAQVVKGGGYDLTEITEKLLAGGYIDFTIDQQPYLQGFFPILELFLYKVSKGLTGMADVDTGLKFLNKETIITVLQHEKPLRGHLLVARSLIGAGRGGRVRQRSSDTSSIRGSVRRGPDPQRELHQARPQIPDAARGLDHHRHDRDDPVLLGERHQLRDDVEPQDALAVLRAARDPRRGRGVRV